MSVLNKTSGRRGGGAGGEWILDPTDSLLMMSDSVPFLNSLETSLNVTSLNQSCCDGSVFSQDTDDDFWTPEQLLLMQSLPRLAYVFFGVYLCFITLIGIIANGLILLVFIRFFYIYNYAPYVYSIQTSI